MDEAGAPVCGLRGAWSLGGGEGDGDGELRESRERVELAIAGDDEQGSFGWRGVVFWRGTNRESIGACARITFRFAAAFGNTFYYLILSRLRKPSEIPQVDLKAVNQRRLKRAPRPNRHRPPLLSLPPLHSH